MAAPPTCRAASGSLPGSAPSRQRSPDRPPSPRRHPRATPRRAPAPTRSCATLPATPHRNPLERQLERRGRDETRRLKRTVPQEPLPVRRRARIADRRGLEIAASEHRCRIRRDRTHTCWQPPRQSPSSRIARQTLRPPAACRAARDCRTQPPVAHAHVRVAESDGPGTRGQLQYNWAEADALRSAHGRVRAAAMRKRQNERAFRYWVEVPAPRSRIDARTVQAREASVTRRGGQEAMAFPLAQDRCNVAPSPPALTSSPEPTECLPDVTSPILGYDLAHWRARIPLLALADPDEQLLAGAADGRHARRRRARIWSRGDATAWTGTRGWTRCERAKAGVRAAHQRGRRTRSRSSSSVSEATSAVASALDFDGDRAARVVVSEAEFPTVGHVWLAQEKRGARSTGCRVARRHDRPQRVRPRDRRARRAIVSACHGYYLNGFNAGHCARSPRSAHAHGALLFVDAYQTLGTVPIDVKALGRRLPRVGQRSSI